MHGKQSATPRVSAQEEAAPGRSGDETQEPEPGQTPDSSHAHSLPTDILPLSLSSPAHTRVLIFVLFSS